MKDGHTWQRYEKQGELSSYTGWKEKQNETQTAINKLGKVPVPNDTRYLHVCVLVCDLSMSED